jgi:putative DNA primase/helicase
MNAPNLHTPAFAELVRLPQWVCWRKELSRSGKPTKVPYSPRFADRKASSTDPKTWATYERAVAAAKSRGFDGIGFVFTPDDVFCGIDLDHCRDPETGAIEAWAQAEIDRLATYTELSPSGTGVHLIVRAQMPGNDHAGHKQGHVEAYDRARFFTWTGNHLPGTPETIEARQPQLDALCAKYFPADPPAAPAPKEISSLDDRELWDRMFASASGEQIRALFAGQWDMLYSSQSEADMALCAHLSWWTYGDAARIDRMFRDSGLMREKWDERHYGGGETYGQRTVALAVQRFAGTGPQPLWRRQRILNDVPPPAIDHAAYHDTDKGNARRFVAMYGQDVRYCRDLGGWLAWTGSHWRRDAGELVYWMALQVAESLYEHYMAAADEAESKSEASKLRTLAKRAESTAAIKAMLTMVESWQGIAMQPGEFDQRPWLLTVANGTLDLQAGVLHPHRREDYSTKSAAVAFDPHATCPVFLDFLARIFPGKPDVIAFVRRALGYALTGDNSERAMLVLWGSGANGKSTLLEAISDLLGDYAKTAESATFNVKPGQSSTNDLAMLAGARFVTVSETKSGQRLDEALIKRLTGRDKVSARFLFKEFFEFIPTFKLFLATNSRPDIRDAGNAIWARIRLLPFTVSVPPEQQDKRLPDKLRGELSGILNWVLAGCLDWQRRGNLGEPAEVLAATQSYREEQDALGPFLAECCVIDSSVSVKSAELYAEYGRWCEVNHEQKQSTRWFGLRMREYGFQQFNGRPLGRQWLGVGLAREYPDLKAEQDSATDATLKSSDRHSPIQNTREDGKDFYRGGIEQESVSVASVADGDPRLRRPVTLQCSAAGCRETLRVDDWNGAPWTCWEHDA